MSQIDDLFTAGDAQGLLDIALDKSRKSERREAKERLCDLALKGHAEAKDICMQFFGIYVSEGKVIRTRRSWRGTARPASAWQRVGSGRFGALAEGSQDTISLQISGGPRRVRTGDLRRANAATNVLAGTAKCRRVPS